MHRVAVVRARDESVVAASLHVAIARLDGHPCIDSVYVKSLKHTFEIWITVDASADASRYGFRETDVVTQCDEGARVTRKGRTTVTTPLGGGRGRMLKRMCRRSMRDLGACTDVLQLVKTAALPTWRV